jgi:type VI secretion system protein ImpI
MPLRLRITSQQRGKLGDARLKEFAACGGTIGRAQDNDWVLPDEKRFVSGRHALIDFQGGAYYLVDTSRNGVFVNGADTAVGRGHPQRLFDGDRLRLGEYEITVQITGGDENIPDDGMRDSVVRAQLVPLDESMDVKLVDESKLRGLDLDALQKHLTPADHVGNSGSQRSQTESKPNATAAAARPAGSAVQIFFKAAGLQPADLGAARPEEAMQSAGRMLRELLIGLADVIQTRGRVRDALRLTQGLNRPWVTSSPPNTGEALKQLLGHRKGDAPPDEAIRAALLDVKNHHQALFKAMVHALRDFTERFDPDELRGRFDRGLRRSPLLATANRFKYWELYEESYQTLTHHNEGSALPQIMTDELTRAYEQELENLQQGRTSPAAAQPAARR